MGSHAKSGHARRYRAPKVVKPMPVRRANAEIRPREHLTEIEVEKLTVRQRQSLGPERPFFVTSAGIVQPPCAMFTFDHVILVTSPRRWPVRSMSWNTGPNGKPSSLVACQNDFSSSSLSMRSRERPTPGL